MRAQQMSRREWINPLDYLRDRMDIADAGQWITFDPGVVPQYRIIRQQSHDGTLAFTDDLIRQALLPLVLRESYYAPDGPPHDLPHYIVGPIRLATAYGVVDLPCGRFPGQRERLTIPVRTVPPKPVTSAYFRFPDGIHHVVVAPEPQES